MEMHREMNGEQACDAGFPSGLRQQAASRYRFACVVGTMGYSAADMPTRGNSGFSREASVRISLFRLRLRWTPDFGRPDKVEPEGLNGTRASGGRS